MLPITALAVTQGMVTSTSAIGRELPVTPLALPMRFSGGARGRIISVSNDKTLRVWTLASPHPVATVNVHCTPTAIALGLLDSCVFLGSKEGK